MRRTSYLLLITSLLLSCGKKQVADGPIDPFEITEGFQIELMAMEPLIADPVDMEIDELGRWYVVEMHGYPLDLSGSGKVKRLMDTDGDGLPDESIVFADSLVFPTGIMRWKEGFLVTDPPNIFYLEDTDDDGRADKKEVVLTGFAVSNPQHNVNNPEYGIDNWIHVSHEGAVRTKNYEELLGDGGSAVHYPNNPDAQSLPLNANGLFIKFKPDQGLVEMGSARGQFGQTFDSWGHHFLTSNASHLYHVVMDASYMERNEDLMLSSGRTYIPERRGFEIFPITQNPQHQLLTDVGMMTSACGILWYKGGLFPEAYNDVVFTAEPTHNLIHADVVKDLGATFEAVNLFDDHEFLASTDSWFRPVNHYIGPDGAIYILDYYRKIIEHPEWLSDEVIESGDLYAGVDQGRIYRISPSGSSSPAFLDNLDLASMKSGELVQLLNHENSWYRTHAQRLLMDRKDNTIISTLAGALVNQLNPIGKIHAMYILDDMQGISHEMLLSLLKNEIPQVRENAIKIAEKRIKDSGMLVNTLMDMKHDEDPKVRYQLLLTLGELNTNTARDARTEILMQDLDDEWFQWAALSAKNLDISSLLNQTLVVLKDQESEKSATLVGRMSEMISRSGSSAQINSLLSDALISDDIWYAPIVMEGISRASDLQISIENMELLKSKFSVNSNPGIRSISLELLNNSGNFKQSDDMLKKALSLLRSKPADPAFTADILKVIAMSDADSYIKTFSSYFHNQEAPIIRASTLNAFEYVNDKTLLDHLVDLWPDLMPEERTRAIGILIDNDVGRTLILEAIEKGSMQTTSLSWPNTVQLLNSKDEVIRSEARRILQGNELDKDSIWNQYKEALAIQGITSDGKIIFQQACGSCHQKSQENGIAFGPDLASIQNRSKTSLLLDILQPNRSIADGFELWHVELTNGPVLSGVIVDEGPSSLTLRDATGKDQNINRSDINTLKAFETSAMPQNLQTMITVEEMADLLAYLKND